MGTYYMGKVGALVALPLSPVVQANPSKGVAVHEMPRGRAVDIFPIKRTWTMPAVYLDADTRSTFDRLFWLPGPWRLLDAHQRNFLTVNQSTGTDDLLDTTGFRATSGTITSSTTQFRSGTNALKWVVSSGLAAGNGVWTGSSSVSSPVAASDDVPVLASTPYTFSFYVRHSTGTVQLRTSLNWFTAAGVTISTDTGTSTSSSTANFNTRITGTATSPATAGYCRPEMEIGTGTPSASMDIYFDEVMFGQTSTVENFVVGYGVPIVAATELGVDLDLPDRSSYALTLVEL
jgi:hypothetical protein